MIQININEDIKTINIHLDGAKGKVSTKVFDKKLKQQQERQREYDFMLKEWYNSKSKVIELESLVKNLQKRLAQYE